MVQMLAVQRTKLLKWLLARLHAKRSHMPYGQVIAWWVGLECYIFLRHQQTVMEVERDRERRANWNRTGNAAKRRAGK